MANKTCKRCVMNDKIPFITFYEDGECSFCKDYDKLIVNYPQGTKGKKIVNDWVKKVKKHGKNREYDCVTGLSGGFDSTYTLYLLKKLGLRVLAVHMDNGWNSNEAVSNIKNVTDKMSIDLETYVLDWEMFKDLQKAFLNASVPDAEIPTDIAIFGVLNRVAADLGIRHVVIGNNFRTEGFGPTYSYQDGKYISSVYRKMTHKKLKNFPNIGFWHTFKRKYINRISYFKILNYVEYNKEEILPFMKEKLGWVEYGHKHYESIFTRFNQSVIRYKKFGFDARIFEYSALIRSGQMTRDEAIENLKTEPADQNMMKEDQNYVMKKLEFTQEEFNKMLIQKRKCFLDYQTWYPVTNFRKYLKYKLGILKYEFGKNEFSN